MWSLMMWTATFRLHTANLHQAIRSTGFGSSSKAACSAVIVFFSTAMIGAFRSEVSELFPRRSAVVRLSGCCALWSWASTLHEFLFHCLCWCVRVKSFDPASVPVSLFNIGRIWGWKECGTIAIFLWEITKSWFEAKANVWQPQTNVKF